MQKEEFVIMCEDTAQMAALCDKITQSIVRSGGSEMARRYISKMSTLGAAIADVHAINVQIAKERNYV